MINSNKSSNIVEKCFRLNPCFLLQFNKLATHTHFHENTTVSVHGVNIDLFQYYTSLRPAAYLNLKAINGSLQVFL